ncbi:hypothetical protein HispidOSU_016904 [Sigmodon hispidus]
MRLLLQGFPDAAQYSEFKYPESNEHGQSSWCLLHLPESPSEHQGPRLPGFLPHNHKGKRHQLLREGSNFQGFRHQGSGYNARILHGPDPTVMWLHLRPLIGYNLQQDPM